MLLLISALVLRWPIILFHSIYLSKKKNGCPLVGFSARLFMDEGTFKKPGIRIATNCFTMKEVVLLSQSLENKFNIKSTLHLNNNKSQLYIKSESMNKLKELIIPYIIPEMLYKLGL